MISALRDVVFGSAALIVYFLLVAALAWVFGRSWGRTRPLPQREGSGRIVAQDRTSVSSVCRPDPGLTHAQWRDQQMRMRGGYTGTRLPDPPYPAPKKNLPRNARIIDDTIAEWLKREGIS